MWENGTHVFTLKSTVFVVVVVEVTLFMQWGARRWRQKLSKERLCEETAPLRTGGNQPAPAKKNNVLRPSVTNITHGNVKALSPNKRFFKRDIMFGMV